MGKLKQSLIDACEKLDWTVREYEDGSVELEKYSPAGEDFIVSASAETFVRDVKQYAAERDYGEYLRQWCKKPKLMLGLQNGTHELFVDPDDQK